MENFDLLNRIGVLPKIVRHLKSGFQPSLSEHLKKSEISLLMELKHNPGYTMKHYLAITDIEPGSFTYLADKLESRELVKRVKCTLDKRKTLLYLTDNGDTLTEDLMQQFDDHIYKQIEKLSDSEKELLIKTIISLESILEKLEN